MGPPVKPCAGSVAYEPISSPRRKLPARRASRSLPGCKVTGLLQIRMFLYRQSGVYWPEGVSNTEACNVSDSESIAAIVERWSGLGAEESTHRVGDLVARGRAAAARILPDRYGEHLSEEGRARAEQAAPALSRGTGAGAGNVQDVPARPGPALDVDVGLGEETGGGYCDVASGWQDLPVGTRVHALWRRLGYTVPGGGMAEVLRRGKERVIDLLGLRNRVGPLRFG